MAISPHDPLGQDSWERRREDMISTVDRCVALAQDLVDGKVHENFPWTDRTFQRALIEKIKEYRRYKEDAKKLAIIKEVFGGKS